MIAYVCSNGDCEETRLLYKYIYSDSDGDETSLHIYSHDTEVKFVNAITAGGSVNFCKNNAT